MGISVRKEFVPFEDSPPEETAILVEKSGRESPKAWNLCQRYQNVIGNTDFHSD